MKGKIFYKAIICILIAILFAVNSGLFSICQSVTVLKLASENNMAGVEENTGTEDVPEYAKITWSGKNLGNSGSWDTYKKNGSLDYNVICAQYRENINTSLPAGNPGHVKYEFRNEEDIFKDEASFKKMNWIVENLWYTYGGSEEYSINDLAKILNAADSSITLDEVNNIFRNENSAKSQKLVFCLFQAISWTYTKQLAGKDEFKPYDRFPKLANGDVTKSDIASFTKIYGAIIKLANEHYEDNVSCNISINAGDIVYDSSINAYVWNDVEINSTFLLDYDLEIEVDGNSVNLDVLLDLNNKTITFPTTIAEGAHSFRISASSYRVKHYGVIWKHKKYQNFIEINSSVREPGFATISKYTTQNNEYIDGQFNLNIKKVDLKGNAVNNVTFNVNGLNSQESEDLSTGASNSVSKQYAIDSEGEKTITINEVQVAATSEGKSYVTLNEPVDIKVYTSAVFDHEETNTTGSGTEKTYYYKYKVDDVKFSNGSIEQEVMLKNKQKVKLNIVFDKNNQTAEVTIPNAERKFDLALTKTIVSSNEELLKYDINKDNQVDSSDATIVYMLIGNINDNPGITISEAFRQTMAIEPRKTVYDNYYDGLPEEELMKFLDSTEDGVISNEDASQLLNISARQGNSRKVDRILSINNSNLADGKDTTATYNMDKTVKQVKVEDTILYKITVYNEGDLNAGNVEITDYLPEGLVVVNKDGDIVDSGVAICKEKDTEYSWTISGNGKVATYKFPDDFKLNRFNGKVLYSYDAYITCKIDPNLADDMLNSVLYNVAEITNAKAYDDDGTEIKARDDDDNEIPLKDRDSSTNNSKEKTQTSDVTSLINKYKNDFEEFEEDEGTSYSINKTDYDYEDDDDFERIKIMPPAILDLALRKSITKVVNNAGTTNYDRLPVVNEESVSACKLTGTGEYFHKKDAIKVNRGDKIEYTIRVYNEGGANDYAGRATEITDYLPNGIKPVAIVDSDGTERAFDATTNVATTVADTESHYGNYTATYSAADNKIVIVGQSLPALEPKVDLEIVSSLSKSTSPSAITGFYNGLVTEGGEIFKIKYCYQEIKVICEVEDTAESNKLLTNVAEITRYEAVDSTTGNVVSGVEDRDSSPNVEIVTGKSFLKNKKVNLSTYYEDRGINDEKDLFPGLEDDDDFETVVVLGGNFKLNLTKYVKNEENVEMDTEEPLAGAKFEIVISDGTNEIYNSSTTNPDGLETDQNGKISEIEDITISNTGITYTVTVTEKSAPEGYIKIAPITFNVQSQIEGGAYTLVPASKQGIGNYAQVTVREDEIYIQVEDRVEPIIHKGVKTVENQASGFDKNEIQKWVINSTIPAGIADYSKYVITDEIDPEKTVVSDKRLSFVNENNPSENVVVKYKENNEILLNGTHYTVEFDTSNKKLTITFIDDTFEGGKSLTAGNTLEITYNTKFALDNNGNIIGINQAIPNEAILKYKVNSGEDKTKKSEKPEVHTGGVGVFKYDAKTKNALAGAHFKIAKSELDARAGRFVKEYDEDGNITNNDLEIVTDANGKGVFEGLEFGEDAINSATNRQADGTYKYDWSKAKTNYWIVETETPKEYLPIDEIIPVTVQYENYQMTDLKEFCRVGNKKKIYDLSLRKFITQVEDEIITDREPEVKLTDEFKDENNDEVTTAKYEHTKEPVIVQEGNIVTYTIRVYNEGPQDAYAAIVKDDIPEGLEFVAYEEGDGSTNDEYAWKLVDENDNEVTDVSKAKYVVTDYLSKEKGDVDNNGLNSNLIKGYNSKTMTKLDYRDVKVQFKVVEPKTSNRVLINYAQISKMTNSDNEVVTDRDSTPNKWIDKDDDQDIEKIRLTYFDLSLRKWVTKAIVYENGKEVVTETGHHAEDDPEDVVKVDLKKSKLDSVVVKFEYSIRVKNEGPLEGYAKEIKDYIPEGLKFIPEDNPGWTEISDGVITTDALKDTLLKHDETAEVTVILTWINSENNLGLKTNTAEISKDYNKLGITDFDSVPDNKKPFEDDIDIAEIMLTITTGEQTLAYIVLTIGFITVIAVGVRMIKRFME